MTDHTPRSPGDQPEEPQRQGESPTEGTSGDRSAAGVPEQPVQQEQPQASPDEPTRQSPAAEQSPAAGQSPAAEQGQPSYMTQPYPRASTWQHGGYGPPMNQVQSSGARTGGRRGGGFAIGVVLLALVVGLLGGGVGGVVGYQFGSTHSSGPSALDESKPARSASTAPAGSVQQVADKMLPSVVQLQVQSMQGSGEGSGIVLSSDGYILTNNHVAQGAKQGQMTAMFHDNRSAPVEVVGSEPNSDLAVIKADITGLVPADLGRSDDLPVGAPVVAIGSPFGLSGTVTSGIVSAKDRPVRAGGETGRQSSVLNALQTDAAINPGNSGGPLVDMDGRVIGINSAIYSPGSGQQQAGSVGLGFAIPIDQARRIANELKTTGSATQAALGVRIMSSDSRPGAQVVDVTPGGAAEKAGIRPNELITKFGDRPIQDGDTLVAAVRSHTPGEKVTVTISAPDGSSERTVEAKLTGERM